MRSRYTAFARRDTDYLIRTWHPTTRPARLELGRSRRYTRLQILGKVRGGLFDDQGEVHFRAHYLDDGQLGAQEENSRFVRESGAWLYVAAISDAIRHGAAAADSVRGGPAQPKETRT